MANTVRTRPDLDTAYCSSPIGLVEVRSDDTGVKAITFVENEQFPINETPLNTLTIKQLLDYFGKKRTTFDLPLSMEGTPFQIRVWNALLEIPFGKTTSYLALSQKLGDVKAIRAVGTANGRNPFAIVVPCHRVIGSDGSLTGYAGGLERKRFLLDLENPPLSLF